MVTKTNVVLVHGAWADGSSWSKVIPLLQQNGFNVTAAQIPLTSLADDTAVTKNLLASQKGPSIKSDIVDAGHFAWADVADEYATLISTGGTGAASACKTKRRVIVHRLSPE